MQLKAKIKRREDSDILEQMTKIATLGVGSSFGDLALINNKPRTATVICASKTQLATMNKENYEKILKKIDDQIKET